MKHYVLSITEEMYESCAGSELIVYHPGCTIGYFAAEVDKLTEAIQFALQDKVVLNAKRLAENMATENGARDCAKAIARCL